MVQIVFTAAGSELLSREVTVHSNERRVDDSVEGCLDSECAKKVKQKVGCDVTHPEAWPRGLLRCVRPAAQQPYPIRCTGVPCITT